MNSIFDIIEEAGTIYSFLLNKLIKIFVFSDFDISDEESCFGIEFSKNSSIRKYSCTDDPSFKISGLWINVFLDKNVVSYKTSLTMKVSEEHRFSQRCESLGYKDKYKVFTSKQDVLDECLRLENAFVETTSRDLNKSEGECSICNVEKTLVEFPCHNSHTVCEECTAKIVDLNCVCPFCRSVLPTTVILKEHEYFEDYDEEDEHFEDYDE